MVHIVIGRCSVVRIRQPCYHHIVGLMRCRLAPALQSNVTSQRVQVLGGVHACEVRCKCVDVVVLLVHDCFADQVMLGVLHRIADVCSPPPCRSRAWGVLQAAGRML